MGWLIAAVIGRAGMREILIQAGSDPAHLPSVALPAGPVPSADVAVDTIARLLGAAVVPLRVIERNERGDTDRGVVVVEAEPWTDAPTGTAWLDPEPYIDALQPAEAHSIVRRRAERAAGVTESREPAWARPGWHARTTSWMRDRLAEIGSPLIGEPRLVYQSPIGSVVRAHTTAGDVFLKGVPTAFRHEASITRALSLRSPGAVPDVLAVDVDENWLLMRDFGGRPIEDEPESSWPDALRHVAGLQRSWMGATDDVIASGGQSRPLEELTAAVPGMLELDGLADRLEPTVREAWLDAVPRLTDACRALDGLGVPDALIHGDLHPGNVAATRRGTVVFDWSDAAVGNPFVDLAVFLRRTKDLAVRRRLRDAYIDVWTDVLQRDRLETAAELAMTVGALYQVATYQILLPALDPIDGWTFDGADAWWVGRAIDGLKHGLDAGAFG